MTIAIIFGTIAVNVVSFGLGYALGYNKAKHPEKVDAQLEKAAAKVQSIFKNKP